jgi:hypothetical protein
MQDLPNTNAVHEKQVMLKGGHTQEGEGKRRKLSEYG